MSRAALARSLLVAALLPTAALADAPCLPLGGQIALCPESGVWADAVAIPGDPETRAFEAPPFYLEAIPELVDRAEFTTADAALSMIEMMLTEEALAEGEAAPARRQRDMIVTDHATIAFDLFTEVMDGAEFPLAVLLTEDDDVWLTLLLSGNEPMDADAFEQSARDLAAALRPATEE